MIQVEVARVAFFSKYKIGKLVRYAAHIFANLQLSSIENRALKSYFYIELLVLMLDF